ncbi:MAG TPA: hypothetical protein VNF07_07625 [Acidimicrobiales bacterium]|nr:hypothetical protein [Acidimicrobiales bacterium]
MASVIVVKVERWPDGVDHTDPANAKRSTVLAHAEIKNDGSGDRESGNYEVTVFDPAPYYALRGDTLHGEVRAFPRRQLGVWDLVHRALGAVLGTRDAHPEKDWRTAPFDAVEH